MSDLLIPIILAGGSGTRLWPLSRKNFPKQFLCFQGENSLLQHTLERVSLLNCQQAMVVSNESHYFLCQEQLSSLSINYLLEPCARNTAAAIAAAAYSLLESLGPEAIMLVLPSDHWFQDPRAWQKYMEIGVKLASESSKLITFGIKPDSPQTGYGYIEAREEYDAHAYKIHSFREKPNLALAQSMLADGHYYWNSGIFIFKAGRYLEELQYFAPDIANACQMAVKKAYRQHDFLRLDESSFSQCRNESIDYALMEKTSQALVVPAELIWSDLGCWNAVAKTHEVDAKGNALTGNVIAKDSYNCLIRSDKTLVTTMGIQDQIIVATPDAVLIADKGYSQEVKDLVSNLSKIHGSLTEDHLCVHRPWGYYEILAESQGFKVKRLMVKPGAKLSLQRHEHRAEHWVVVAGEAEIINGNTEILLKTNQSTYIPPKTLHRLSNLSSEPLYVIEVQTGTYLGEDDIQRFDDIYQRKLKVV